MSKSNKVKITLEGPGLSYNREIDEDVAGQILSLCLTPQRQDVNSNKSAPKTVPQAIGNQVESAAEYMTNHDPKRNPDKILSLAGFLSESRGKNSFQKGEIKSLFRDAGEILPANFTRDFKWTISNGWIGPDTAKKGNYFVTNTGWKVLRASFPEESIKETKYKTSARRKKSKTSKLKEAKP